MMRSSSLPSSGLRRGLLAGAAVTTALLLSACGGGDHETAADTGMNHGAAPAATSAAASAGATFNDADVMFAQMMIPHHQEAVEMAAMADGRAASAQVKDLAAKIKAAQQPEIDTMTGWLTAWGRAPMPDMSGGMDHGMPGDMSDADMAALYDAKGAAFDKQFLTLMVEHHEGAVEMGQEQVAKGSNPEAKALAAKIITDQQAEIATMKQLLAGL
ncbi:DUF305 domain-containing protein [Actinoplanes xinjiangensis]|uniref:Uncharacterized protein (DUF305 family) n=1 Tax=Actinoplanes xinjiangensis TaxID=512350 RepID=A0A316FPL8_9ACTN|nr:DUF305 domain-containing protein [Actinoplanes xinjiangensis]PWK40439.1 uncharacterized protein (DUF305 family) [Actinoplanes xinjiangensis]GIF42342.1 lipoprotein [Actinoplanes xinjiangensis]